MKIGLVLDNLNEEYQQSVYAGIVQEAEKRSVSLVCIQSNTFHLQTNPLRQLFEDYRDLPVQGFVVFSSLLVDYKELFRADSVMDPISGKPVVFIGGKIDDRVSVIADIENAMSSLVIHLLEEHNYRKFLYLGGSESNYDNICRISVVRRALEKYKTKYPDIDLEVINGDLFTENTGYNLIKKYCLRYPHKNRDVIIAGTDHMAVGIMSYLKSQAPAEWKNCPITGFDDVPDAVFQDPPLTTVRQPLVEMGRKAIENVLRLINGEKLPLEVQSDAEFRVRESCGCVRKEGFPYELREIKLEQRRFVQSADRFGQMLMDAQKYADLEQPLNYFLNELEMKLFYLVLFSRTSIDGETYNDLIFSRKEGLFPGVEPNHHRIRLKEFFDTAFPYDDDLAKQYHIFQLRAGNELLGFVLYSADDPSHLAISYRSGYLSNIIKRLQLLEKDKAYTRDLELLVELRSKKLAEEMARRIEVEAEVLKISELERRRFSMDIHDDICQRLASISLMCRGFSGKDPLMNRMAFLLEETLQLTRQYAYSSFPIDLEAVGLENALQHLCSDIEEQSAISCGIMFETKVPDRFDNRETINIYRIIQEALHNSIRHADPGKLQLTGSGNNDVYTFTIKDDGVGNQEIMKNRNLILMGRRPRGLGLRSMQYRADQLGAEFSIFSSESEGTAVTLKVPLKTRKKNG